MYRGVDVNITALVKYMRQMDKESRQQDYEERKLWEATETIKAMTVKEFVAKYSELCCEIEDIVTRCIDSLYADLIAADEDDESEPDADVWHRRYDPD